MTDLKPPWHLRPAASCPPNLSADYSDVFNCEGSTVARVCQENAKGYAAAIVAAPVLKAQRDSLLKQCEMILAMLQGLRGHGTIHEDDLLLDDHIDRICDAIIQAKGEA